MNRHFIDYSALPTEVLGTPIRPEPAKPRDGEWKPLRPGYESRTLAGGAVEVRCTSLPTQPVKPADPPSASAVSALAAPAPAGDVPEGGQPTAPTEWQSGAPPSAGWYETFKPGMDEPSVSGGRIRYRYFDGANWGCFVRPDDDFAERLRCMDPKTTGGEAVEWRGPRLTGDAWPEPQQ